MMQQVVYQSGAVDQSDQFQILDKVDSGKTVSRSLPCTLRYIALYDRFVQGHWLSWLIRSTSAVTTITQSSYAWSYGVGSPTTRAAFYSSLLSTSSAEDLTSKPLSFSLLNSDVNTD